MLIHRLNDDLVWFDAKRPGKQFFKSCWNGATASWVLPVLFFLVGRGVNICLAQGHNTATPLNDEYITLVFAVPGSLLLQKKANSDTFSVEVEASSFQSFGTPRGNLCYGPRHLNNAAGDWSKV